MYFFFVLIVTLKFASEGRDCKDDLVQCRHYSCKYCELSVFQELPTTACHLLVEIVKELFVLDYSRVHSLNHGQFQINCATISSTTCFSSSLVSFSMEISSDSGRISSISLIFILFTCMSFRLLSSSSRTLINVSWKVLFQSDGQIAITLTILKKKNPLN